MAGQKGRFIFFFIFKDTLKNSFSVIPEVFIGNPVLLQSTSYRCPIETFGHDNFKKGGFSESP
ncbi:MAG: hypothetical protein A2X87_01290 [Deltaproteobacteria bacterium GWC2_42_51]|nr:MAG: hypothetical protein A2067_03200 [Deltaproteobacteria bacterium GWB2_42_7]OGP33364.1 MAG: hypothetical protein A2X87_01290 [Deltaproteobacteria bacterium GWC2_42_51]